MNKYVVVIGASNVDIFADADTLHMNDSNIGTISTSLGGVGRNIAENIGLLGINVVLLSITGNDIYGDLIINETDSVNMENVIRADQNSGVYLSVGKEMMVAVNDMLINETITIADIKKNHSLINNAELIVLDTNFPEIVLEYIAKTYNDKKIILDPVSGAKCMKVKPFIGLFHTIKPNILEAEYLTDMEIVTEKDLKRACSKFHDKGVTEVFITLGESGVYYSSVEDSGILHVQKIDSKNVTGAGDAFVAGLVYANLKENNIKSKAEIASKASAIALQSEETINKKLSKELLED